MRSDEFMNAEDVARYLHLGKNTVYQLAKTGKLASYHVGRKLKFTLEDVESYVASTHHAKAGQLPSVLPTLGDRQLDDQSLSDAASFGALSGTPFVIAGSDVVSDLIASSLNAAGMPATRLVHVSYTALVNLYAGDADAAVVHLYDQKSNGYNVAYARSLAPGASVVIMRLYGREAGFIVKAGNPKRLNSWGSLLREGVCVSNRVKGCGARILLDEKLRAMDARSESLEGYDSRAGVASAAVKRVASGMADVAIGTEREAQHPAGLEFVPLQTEWVDIVVAKNPKTRPLIKQLSALFADDDFRRAVTTLGKCDVSKMGSIVYES